MTPVDRTLVPTTLPYFASVQPATRLILQLLNYVLLVGIAYEAVKYGLEIRRNAWEASTDIHFEISMDNALQWGYEANTHGFLTVYENRIQQLGDKLNQHGPEGQLALDYPPLRLLIMTRWEAWTRPLQLQQVAEDLRQRIGRGKKITPQQEAYIARMLNAWTARPHWENTYKFNWPLLWLNTGCELFGAAVMFLLVHYWLRQCSGAPTQQWIDPLRCAWPAMISALLIWFSPAVIYSAHCYPQWDVWILPPFLLAIYLGILDRWLVAGMCIGIVSMGKGQILLITPALMLWQLFMLNPGGVYRLAVGIALSIGLIASPWLVSTPLAFRWMSCVLLGLAILLALFFLRDWTEGSLVIQAALVIAAAATILWPWTRKPYPLHVTEGICAFITLAVAARFLPRRWIPAWGASAIAVSLFACYPLFQTSWAWYTIGIKFPTQHWQVLEWCEAMNLGGILEQNFGWRFPDTIQLQDYLPFVHVPGLTALRVTVSALFLLCVGVCIAAILKRRHAKNQIVLGLYIGVLTGLFCFVTFSNGTERLRQLLEDNQVFPMRYLMIASYFIGLFLCAIGMAVHARRRDRMFFFAMVAPWVLLFTLLPQMQNRYLMWAAAFSAATASFSLDGFLLFLLLNGVSIADTALDQLRKDRHHTAATIRWLHYLNPLFPSVGYAMLVVAGIYLCLALKRDHRRLAVLEVGRLSP